MASFRQRQGKWQARVRRLGQPDLTKTFRNKNDAERWARAAESEMDRGTYTSTADARRVTLGELLLRFVREVTPTMKSAEADTIRLNAIARKPIARHTMATLTPARLAAYRDARLREVSAGTVLRELAYLSSIINHARGEWGLGISNPLYLVRRPATPLGRTRVLTDDERVRLLDAVEARGRRSPWMKPLVSLALETAMRRGELLTLRWENVQVEQRIALLPMTKNGQPRTVPLSTAAVHVLKALPHDSTGRVFPLEAGTVHAAFKRAVRRAGLVDLRFHDLRHTAVSAMSKKLPNVIELSAVSGHRNLAMLKRYYHVTAEELARKLG